MIYRHAAVQVAVALLILSLFAATDTWYLITGFGMAKALNISVAAVAGAIITTIVHEWSHYLGARLSGASYSIPGRYGLFVYDFDFGANSLHQFNVMSVAGQVGSWVSVFLLWNSLPMDTPGRVMLVSGAVASAIFAGMVELPVMKRAQTSGDPLAELSKIDLAVLRRSALGGVSAGLLLWYLAT
jgi:hypothetical protein